MKLTIFHLLILGITLQATLAAFTQENFANCYIGCTRQYATGVKAQSIAFSGKGKTDFLTAIYQYERCTRGLTEEVLNNLYNAGNSHSADFTNHKYDGYCDYFWNKFQPQYATQQDLLETVTTCFKSDDSSKGCKFVNPITSHSVLDGSSHYALYFDQCLTNCVDLTKQEDQGIFDKCTKVCDEDYDQQSGGTPPNSDQNTAWDKYNDCKKYSEKCGQLGFYTFSDYQYSTYYEECNKPCVDGYKADADKYTPRVTYLDCVGACKIPSADTFQRLNNTVIATGAEYMKFCLGMLVVVLMALF